MSGFHPWAERLHRESLKKPKKSKNPRFGCNGCNNKTTKNYIKIHGTTCRHCGSQLKVKIITRIVGG